MIPRAEYASYCMAWMHCAAKIGKYDIVHVMTHAMCLSVKAAGQNEKCKSMVDGPAKIDRSCLSDTHAHTHLESLSGDAAISRARDSENLESQRMTFRC